MTEPEPRSVKIVHNIRSAQYDYFRCGHEAFTCPPSLPHLQVKDLSFSLSLPARLSLCAVVLQAFWHAHNIYRGMEVQPTKQRQEEGSVSSVIVVIRANAGKLIVVPTSQLLQINEEKANICANSVLRQILASSIPFHFQPFLGSF